MSDDLVALKRAEMEAYDSYMFWAMCNTANADAETRVKIDLGYTKASQTWQNAKQDYERALAAHKNAYGRLPCPM